MIEIKEGELVLARHMKSEEIWKEGLSFFSQDQDFIQVGSWGYDKDKYLLPHIHNEVTREVFWTQEVIFVKKGKIKAHIFGTDEKKITDIEVTEGDVIILLRGGHGYTILENGTQVLEIKNGPYVGADKDRRRFEVK